MLVGVDGANRLFLRYSLALSLCRGLATNQHDRTYATEQVSSHMRKLVGYVGEWAAESIERLNRDAGRWIFGSLCCSVSRQSVDMLMPGTGRKSRRRRCSRSWSSMTFDSRTGAAVVRAARRARARHRSRRTYHDVLGQQAPARRTRLFHAPLYVHTLTSFGLGRDFNARL